MRPAAAILTAVALTVSLPAAASGRFTDDDGRPGEQALEWLAERGVVDGCDPPAHQRVCPDLTLSRAQAAKILVGLARTEGIMAAERPGDADHFSDDDTVWGGGAEPYIDHLADVGIVHGCDPPANRSFCPRDILRRGEITKMMVGAFGLGAPARYPTPWTDTAGAFFEEAARVAAFHGMFDSSAGIFEGHRSVSRAEFARVVAAVFAPDLCADDPFSAARIADLEARYPGVSFTAYVHDLDTGCSYSMNPDHRQQTASVFKVMVMGGTFLEAQAAGRSVSGTERAWLEEMITVSADSPVRELWRSFGGSPWFSRQADRFGLTETEVVGDQSHMWGRTTSSAYDQGRLLGSVLLGEGELVDIAHRELAVDLMTSVVPSQSWGVAEGVPAGWTVAHKNGFAGEIANSVGVVYDDRMQPDYVVTILTFGWSDWRQGVPAVERVASWVSSTLAD